jgi:hypothetical protein
VRPRVASFSTISRLSALRFSRSDYVQILSLSQTMMTLLMQALYSLSILLSHYSLQCASPTLARRPFSHCRSSHALHRGHRHL